MTKSLIIAETNIFESGISGSKRFSIKIRMPDLDPKGNGNMRCGVYISGVGLKYTYGEDSFQALGLAYVYIKIKIQTLLNDGIDLYHDRQMKSPYDAALIILNDYSAFMEK